MTPSLDAHSHASCATKRTGRAHGCASRAAPTMPGLSTHCLRRSVWRRVNMRSSTESRKASWGATEVRLKACTTWWPMCRQYTQSCRRSNSTQESEEAFSPASRRSTWTRVLHGAATDDQLRPSTTHTKSSGVMSSW